MRIVYVEDNLANVHLVKRVARMGKHEVINYIDGMDALNNFDSDKPDLVLMDIQLAGELTGIEVVQKLRNEGYTTPIIAVTAYAMVGDKERCLEAGCTDYMSKPIPVGDLVDLLKKYDRPQQETNEESVEDTTTQDKPTPTETKATINEPTIAQTSETPAKTPIISDTTDKPTTDKVTETAEQPPVVESKEKVEDNAVADTKSEDPSHKQPTLPSINRTQEKSFDNESEDHFSTTKPARQPLVKSDSNDNLTDNDPETTVNAEDSLSTQQVADDKHAKMQ